MRRRISFGQEGANEHFGLALNRHLHSTHFSAPWVTSTQTKFFGVPYSVVTVLQHWFVQCSRLVIVIIVVTSNTVSWLVNYCSLTSRPLLCLPWRLCPPPLCRHKMQRRIYGRHVRPNIAGCRGPTKTGDPEARKRADTSATFSVLWVHLWRVSTFKSLIGAARHCLAGPIWLPNSGKNAVSQIS